jgi:fluoride exporter
VTAGVWIAVALLGGLGALARFHVDGLVQRRTDGTFPVGTLVVNLTGSFALGILVGAGVGGNALLLAGTGALGSFTTFSTWMLETERLAEDGERRVAGANVAVPVVAGLAVAAAGWAIGGTL